METATKETVELGTLQIDGVHAEIDKEAQEKHGRVNRHRVAIETANDALASWALIKSDAYRESWRDAEVTGSWEGYDEGGLVSLVIHLAGTEAVKDVLRGLIPIIRNSGFMRDGQPEMDKTSNCVTYKWKQLPPGYEEEANLSLRIYPPKGAEGSPANCRWVLVCDGEEIAQ